MIVLDASVCAPWFLGDEISAQADRAAEVFAVEGGVVPAIWPFEIRNLLLSAMRRGRLTADLLARMTDILDSLTVEVDDASDWKATMELARAQALSFYDAAYLELALRRGLMLATLDRRLEAAAIGRECPVLAI